MPNPFRDKIVRAIRRLRVRSCEVPFVIWFRERSGSTHLCSLLDMHPHIKCRYEDFHERPEEAEVEPGTSDLQSAPGLENGRGVLKRRLLRFNGRQVENPDTTQVVSHLYDIFSFPSFACGFKFKYPLQPELFPEVVSELKSLGLKLHMIVLSRRNFVKQAVSSQNLEFMRASVNDAANLPANQVSGREKFQPIKIDIARAVRYTHQLKAEHHAFLAGAREFGSETSCRILQLDYENLLYDQTETMKRIFAYLNVADEHQVVSSVRKAIPDDLSKAVLNFDEMEKAFSDTEFSRMLSEGVSVT